MKNVLTLLKVMLKVNFLFPALRGRTIYKKRERINIIILKVILSVIAFPLLYAYLFIIRKFFEILQPIGQTNALLILGILITQILILIFGIFSIVSIFYLSKDMELLIPLPIKPHQVILSKFFTLLVNEYFVISPFILPLFIYYGILANVGIGYWLRLPFIFLFIPIIPLAVTSLLVVVMMRLINFRKHKDKLIVIGSLLMMVLIIIPQFMAKPSENSGLNNEQVVNFFTSDDGLVKLIGNKFPPAIWITRSFIYGFSNNAYIDQILFYTISVLLFVSLILLGEKLFYKGVIGINEVSITPIKKIKYLSFSDGAHPIRSIFLRELRMMNRIPMFLLNGVISSLFIPIFMFLIIIFKAGEFDFFISAMKKENLLITSLYLAAFFILCGGLNGTAASSFSREGKYFWISKVIPVSFHNQITGKFFHALAVSILGIIGGAIVTLILFKINLISLLLGLLIAIIGTIAFIAIGFSLDLRKPLLDWISYQKAMKQNINVFFHILIEFTILFCLGYSTVIALNKKIAPLYIIYIFILIFFILLAIIAILYLLKTAEKEYTKIEI